MRFLILLSCCVSPLLAQEPKPDKRKPIPERLVVLTFDDSSRSHFTVVAPMLKEYGFGATFFVTEGFDFPSNKTDFMTWEEIARLDSDGFEIGNHTRDHMGVTTKTVGRLREQLEAINKRCEEHGIPNPVSFAWPGNAITPEAFSVLTEAGIRYARRGGAPEYSYEFGKGFAYDPGFDHPLLIPSAGDARPTWKLEDFKRAVNQTGGGRIAVLQFHGVPDTAHDHVSTQIAIFRSCMQYLKDNAYTVIAMRDLERYQVARGKPVSPFQIVEDRKAQLAAGSLTDNARLPKGDVNLKYWLENMVGWHGFETWEVQRATGLSYKEIEAALKRFNITQGGNLPSVAEELKILPYPGGRHPRIGFRDGEIRPQRETKVSVFLPWNRKRGDYVVLDIPEAIRRNNEPEHGLLYLAHDHVPTMWTKQDIPLKPLEWQHQPDEALQCIRNLPNGVEFGTWVKSHKDHVEMKMWMKNGSKESLSNLRVQNCVMLRQALEFNGQTGDNKFYRAPYAAVRNEAADRWIITAWEGCERAWGNNNCPCLHSDPQFPDLKPGDRHELRGWLSFYEGTDIESELDRIAATGWYKE